MTLATKSAPFTSTRYFKLIVHAGPSHDPMLQQLLVQLKSPTIQIHLDNMIGLPNLTCTVEQLASSRSASCSSATHVPRERAHYMTADENVQQLSNGQPLNTALGKTNEPHPAFLPAMHSYKDYADDAGSSVFAWQAPLRHTVLLACLAAKHSEQTVPSIQHSLLLVRAGSKREACDHLSETAAGKCVS